MPFTKELLILVALTAAGAWMAYTFSQEVYLSQRLGQEAAQLRQQNAALQAQNDSERRDIVALASGAAAEEEARLNGFARRDEKVYLVSAPPASPAPRAVAKVGQRNQKESEIGSLRRWVVNLWHR